MRSRTLSLLQQQALQAWGVALRAISDSVHTIYGIYCNNPCYLCVQLQQYHADAHNLQASCMHSYAVTKISSRPEPQALRPLKAVLSAGITVCSNDKLTCRSPTPFSADQGVLWIQIHSLAFRNSAPSSLLSLCHNRSTSVVVASNHARRVSSGWQESCPTSLQKQI